MKALLVGLTVMFGSSVANASFEDGNSLFDLCASDAEWQNAICAGYAVAIADAMHYPSDPLFGYTACFPAGTSRKEVEDVAKTFVARHPELRDYVAASLLARAFSVAFPCEANR